MDQYPDDAGLAQGEITALIVAYDALVEFGVAVWTSRIAVALRELELKATYSNYEAGDVAGAFEIILDFLASEGIASFNRRQPDFGWPDLTGTVLQDAGLSMVGCLDAKEAKRVHQLAEAWITDAEVQRIGDAYGVRTPDDRAALIRAGQFLNAALQQARLQGERFYLVLIVAE